MSRSAEVTSFPCLALRTSPRDITNSSGPILVVGSPLWTRTSVQEDRNRGKMQLQEALMTPPSTGSCFRNWERWIRTQAGDFFCTTSAKALCLSACRLKLSPPLWSAVVDAGASGNLCHTLFLLPTSVVTMPGTRSVPSALLHSACSLPPTTVAPHFHPDHLLGHLPAQNIGT